MMYPGGGLGYSIPNWHIKRVEGEVAYFAWMEGYNRRSLSPAAILRQMSPTATEVQHISIEKPW